MFASGALMGAIFRPFLESNAPGTHLTGSLGSAPRSGLTPYNAPPPCIPGCSPCQCCPPACPPPCYPPALSGLQDSPSSKGAVAKISWIDDLGTSESFVYGLTTGYGSFATPSSHAVTLSGLQVPAVYYLKISASYVCSANGKLESSSMTGSFWTNSTLGNTGGLCPYASLSVTGLTQAISGTTIYVNWSVSPGTNAILGAVISQTFYYGTSYPLTTQATVTSHLSGASSATFTAVPGTVYYVSISASSVCYSGTSSSPTIGVAELRVHIFEGRASVIIGSRTYPNGSTAYLFTGVQYSLSPTSIFGSAFLQWQTSTGVSVAQPTQSSTTLTLSSLMGDVALVILEPAGSAWGGYVQWGSAIDMASATITVPSIGYDLIYQSSTAQQEVAIWVGLGGAGTDLWQAGVDLTITVTWGLHRVPNYSYSYCGFYEPFSVATGGPGQTKNCTMGIEPGNLVTVSLGDNVAGKSCSFDLTNYNQTTKVTTDWNDYSNQQQCGWSGGFNPGQSAAEFVDEAPLYASNYPPCPTNCPLPTFLTNSAFSSIEDTDGNDLYTAMVGALLAEAEMDPNYPAQGTAIVGYLVAGTDAFVLGRTGN